MHKLSTINHPDGKPSLQPVDDEYKYIEKYDLKILN